MDELKELFSGINIKGIETVEFPKGRNMNMSVGEYKEMWIDKKERIWWDEPEAGFVYLKKGEREWLKMNYSI